MGKILVIDDEPEIRAMFRALLEEEGHDVREAENGLLGLEAFNDDPTDLVITDLHMPQVNGLEAIVELLQHENKPRIIAISGVLPPKWSPLKVAAFLGAIKTLKKPLMRDQILATVREVLEDTPMGV